jgi:hypothetical protein
MTTTAGNRFDDPKGYYSILGVDPSASIKDIERAYRQEAKTWHPDLNPTRPGAAERMIAISEAYGILKDPDRRAAYDESAKPKSFTAVPRVVDFGEFHCGEAKRVSVELFTQDVISDLTVSATVGPGWRAEVTPLGTIGTFATITITTETQTTGPLASSITIGTSGFELTIPIRGYAKTVRQGAGSNGNGNGSPSNVPPQAASSRTSPSTTQPVPPGAWSHPLKRFTLWGVISFALLVLYGTGNAGSSVATHHLPLTILPFIQYGAVGLDAVVVGLLAWRTSWFTRGGTALKVASCVVASIGWIGVSAVLLIVVVVLLIIAAALALLAALLGG